MSGAADQEAFDAIVRLYEDRFEDVVSDEAARELLLELLDEPERWPLVVRAFPMLGPEVVQRIALAFPRTGPPAAVAEAVLAVSEKAGVEARLVLGRCAGVQHAWLELADGTIVDPTSEQLGGSECAIVRVGRASYSRYQAPSE